MDALAGASNISFAPGRHGDIAQVKHKGRTLILLKPMTFMNLSGKAVAHWMQAEKINAENILVVSDDIALPFGVIRIRGNGSDGGHNGLKSIDEHLGNNQYARLRFGVGSDFPKGRQADYVLSEWSTQEALSLKIRITKASEAVLSFAAIGLAHTMNLFNGK